MRKQYPLLLAGVISCIAAVAHAQPADRTRGGPVSDALVNAIVTNDEVALNEAWPGKIYELTGQYKATPLEIESSRLFEAVAECDLVYKVDGIGSSLAEMTWECPTRPIADDPCSYETVNIALRTLRFVDESDALFLAVGETYDNDCGPTRPPSLQSILSGVE